MKKVIVFGKEEIKERTGIQLNKDWDIYFIGFIEGKILKHEDSCILYSNDHEGWNEEDCNCNAILVDNLIGKILAHPTPLTNSDGMFAQAIILERKEDFLNKEWKNKETYNNILLEDIDNGLQTLVELLKYYEITGNKDFYEAINTLDPKEINNILYS